MDLRSLKDEILNMRDNLGYECYQKAKNTPISKLREFGIEETTDLSSGRVTFYTVGWDFSSDGFRRSGSVREEVKSFMLARALCPEKWAKLQELHKKYIEAGGNPIY